MHYSVLVVLLPHQKRPLTLLPFPMGKEESRRLEDWGDVATGMSSLFFQASRRILTEFPQKVSRGNPDVWNLEKRTGASPQRAMGSLTKDWRLMIADRDSEMICDCS